MNIKGFDKYLRSRGMQFEIGKEYKIEGEGKLELCTDTVFHYCQSLVDLNEFYSARDEDQNRFCEIEVLGEIVTNGIKFGSNHIRILREIIGEELQILKGHVNGNTGLFNTGEWNTGNMNSGNYNTGSLNWGNYNTGNWNNGDYNAGWWNTGSYNVGHWNIGDYNTGDWNSSEGNTGDYNTGKYNSGGVNTGDHNSGNRNQGDYNSGNGNSGDYNTGSGCQGNGNTGFFNSCDYSTGVFCSIPDGNMRIFNQPSNMSREEFLRSPYYKAMSSVPFYLLEWIEYSEEEKEADENKKTQGGYMQNLGFKEAFQRWWQALSEENRNIIMSLPNFDPTVFYEITGVEV